MKKKNVILIVIGLIILVLVGPYIAIGIKSQINKDILTNLEGEIYYTKRDDSILTLYKSDASLDNEKLIYSHKNKGYLNENDSNDNIIDFHYDDNTGEIDFIAMNDRNWNLFSIKEGEESPKLIGTTKENLDVETALDKTDYINNEHDNLIAFEDKGSIYVEENGEEKLVKKFHGIYDMKFTGYMPIGFSPDGKYLIYSSMEHLTPIGSLIHHLTSGFNASIYIIDLNTRKSAKFIESYDIQWIID